MPLRNRVEIAAAVAAFAICAAFVVSFVFGLREDASPPLTRAADGPQLAVPDPDAGRVEVLNASGRSGVARTATDRLRSSGFDVVYFGNASGFSGDSSVVLARSTRDGVARAVARSLGIAHVRSEPDSTLYLDATVVLGRDWPVETRDSTAAHQGFLRRLVPGR